jgi:hypothetical protein
MRDKNGYSRMKETPGKTIFMKRSMCYLQDNVQTVPGTIPLSLPYAHYSGCISPSGKKILRLRGDSNGFYQKKSFQKDTVDRLTDLIGSRSVNFMAFPFQVSGGSLNYLAKGAGLFLATIFGMENDPRVVRTYETLRLLGEKREGRWCSWSCCGNILRAFIVHPLYRESRVMKMYVKRLGQLQRPDGDWPPQIPFYQTVNALGHLDFLQSDDMLRRSFMTLKEKQNKDGTWGRTQREWNTFLVVHAMKRKHYLLSMKKIKHTP